MIAHRAGGWFYGLALLAALPAAEAWADDVPDLASVEITVPEPPPASLVLDKAVEPAASTADLATPSADPSDARTGSIPAPLDVASPAQPPPPDRAETSSGPNSASPAASEAPAAPVQAVAAPAVAVPALVPATDPLPAAIAARLADAKLPLPPKLSKKDRDMLAAFYGASGYRAFWIRDGAWTEAAKAVLDRLGRADEDGLDPASYTVASFQAGSKPASPEDLAEAELKLSAMLYLYVRDARGGRIEPGRLSGLITPKLELPSVGSVLGRLALGDDPAAMMVAYNPAYPGYRALRDKLAEIRASQPPAAALKMPGTETPIRQAAASMGDGTRLPRTSPGRLEGDIIANMERWRWLPSQVSSRYILVNIPEFRLRLIDNGVITHEARVITGKTETPTPLFTGKMDYAVVNPSWFVPPSIINKQFAGGANAPKGYAVARRGKTVVVRQPPGPNNALGYIKLMFPNDHAVYLHDTPGRHLFASASRAFSHGCVRVEHPFALAGKIMGPDWTEEKLKKLIGWGERYITLQEKFPVNMAYFTTYVDETGELKTYGDLYGYHSRVRAALGLKG